MSESSYFKVTTENQDITLPHFIIHKRRQNIQYSDEVIRVHILIIYRILIHDTRIQTSVYHKHLL
jgi:hypothetical protein